MKLLAFIVFLGFIGTVSISAQKRTEIRNERLTVFVRDLCGEEIEKVKIKIEGEKFKRKLKSNKAGRADIYLPKGTYKMTVSKYGFMRYIVDVQVPENSYRTVTFNMKEGYSTSDPREGMPLRCPPQNNVENVVIN